MYMYMMVIAITKFRLEFRGYLVVKFLNSESFSFDEIAHDFFEILRKVFKYLLVLKLLCLKKGISRQFSYV